MTDNEIVKALGCCFVKTDCTDCPCYVNRPFTEDCLGNTAKQAIDLINRQKAEIERYKENMPYLEQQSLDFCGVLCDFAEELIAKYKSEAAKEFAERLKERKYQSTGWLHGWHPFVVEEDDIDDVLEEMTEETK